LYFTTLHAATAVLLLDQNIDEMYATIKLTKHVIRTPTLGHHHVTGHHRIFCGLLGANRKSLRSHPTVAAVDLSNSPLDRSP